jgi:sensor histidine kinase regulating citrate/malate metabolism
MEGAGVLSVSTWLSADEDKALIRIHNTCKTLPTEADIARYFQPGHSGKGGDTHLGLGLPLAKQAIENAAGTLILHPADGGIEAIVSLPVAAKREPQTERA